MWFKFYNRFKQNIVVKEVEKVLELLASLLSGAATASVGDSRTLWFFYDEPECPEDLL